MKERLAELLRRKTHEARRNAQVSVKSWQEAAETVARAEKRAACDIYFTSPPKTVDVDVMNYVAAVGLASLAQKQSTEAISLAERKLREVVRMHNAAKAKAVQEGLVATSERDSLINAAHREKDSKEALAAKKADKETPKRPNFLGNAGCGLVLGWLINGSLPIFAEVTSRDGHTPTMVGAIGLLIGGYAWIIWPLTTFAIWMMRNAIVDEKKNSRMHAADVNCKSQKAAAEEQFQRRLTTLQETVIDAEAHCERAEAALELLRGNT